VSNAVRDAVVSVFRMPPVIAVEMIAHMNQFFGNDNFERLWLSSIDSRQVDQNSVLAERGEKHVCAAERRADAPS
jgi:hypothetical protein